MTVLQLPLTPHCAAGTCTVGLQQSPIDIPLAEHLAQAAAAAAKTPEDAGTIKFQFEQGFGNGKDVKFRFEQKLDKGANTKFNFEQDVNKYGKIKFGYESNLYEQKMDKYGDLNFKYENQTGATVLNPGHGTPQVHGAVYTMHVCCPTADHDLQQHHILERCQWLHALLLLPMAASKVSDVITAVFPVRPAYTWRPTGYFVLQHLIHTTSMCEAENR